MQNKSIKTVFIWQALILLVFLSLTFTNEVLDLPHLFLGDTATTLSQRSGEVLIELVIFIAVITLEIYLFRTLVRRINILEGFLPICASCKKIRKQDKNQEQWEQIEDYLSKHTLVQFSHSICPECKKKLYPDLF
jgi:hypothetical protein